MNKVECILVNLIDAGKGWNMLSAKEWLVLLLDNCEYVAKCDEVNGWCCFDVSDWMLLLKSRPTYAEKCDKVNGWDKFYVDDVIDFLKENPKLKNIFPRHFWNKFNDNAIDWIRLLDEIPALADKCDLVNGWKHFGTTRQYNEYGNELEKNEWPHFLDNYPQFAIKCDKVNGWKDFEVHHWVSLLKRQPQFAIKCDVYQRWQDFDGYDWVILLREQPHFAKQCDRYGGWRKIDFSLISTDFEWLGEGRSWYVHGSCVVVDVNGLQFDIHDGMLLEEERKSGSNYWREIVYVYRNDDGKEVFRTTELPNSCGRWAELLAKQPTFSDKCDELNGWDTFDGFDWFRLLSAQPRFVGKCNTMGGWMKLFLYHPVESSYYEYDEDGPIHIMKFTHPSFWGEDECDNPFSRECILSADKCLNGLPVYSWIYASTGNMENEDRLPYKCGYFEKEEFSTLIKGLNTDFWKCLLNQKPTLALSLIMQYGLEEIWENFERDDWKDAIGIGKYFLCGNSSNEWKTKEMIGRKTTAFINRITDFDRKDCSDYDPQKDLFDDNFWDSLLSALPDFLDNLDYQCEAWAYLIRHRPSWAAHMSRNEWTRIKEKDWVRLLHPHWQYLEKTTVQADEWFWWNCLSEAPQLADLCEQHDGLATLSNNQLCDLMTKHIELTRYCVKYLQYENMLYENWITLLSHPKESECFMLKCDKYNGWTKFSMRNGYLGWAKLLSVCPQLTNKCTALNGWSEFNGGDWRMVLSEQPQLANFCDNSKGWSKFNGRDWRMLLSEQPQLASFCEDSKGWEMFDREDWMYLINAQPSFSGKYNERRDTCNDREKEQADAEIIKEAKEFVRIKNRLAKYNDWRYEDRASPEELGQQYPNEGY